MSKIEQSQDEASSILHETLFISTFIIKERKTRYLNLLSSKKGRAKFRMQIPHSLTLDLNVKYLHKIKNSDQNVLFILNKLREYSSPNLCYVMAEHSKYDQKYMQIDDALKALFSCGIGYIISCIPGRLLYFEAENNNERYFLHA